MHFRELRLIAFGHFTDRTLVFEGPLGFHLVYGANEAGKSTALRAVSDLLFGVPQQSSDTFLHAGSEIRLAAVLENERGEILRIIRRKGRKNTLLDETGAPLDERATLAPFLGDVDETLFRSMFGLDHERLRLGARELLAGAGSVSESLFGAATHSGQAHRLLTVLREQAEGLFTSRGRGRKRINQGIADVREAHKLVVKSSTTAHGHRERRAEFERASQEVERAKVERARLKGHKSLVERRLTTLPLVAKLRAVLASRAALGAVPELPDGVDEWRAEAARSLEEAERQAAFSSAELERHEALLGQLDIPEALADLDAGMTESLSQRLGQFRKACLDLPKRQAELRAIHEAASQLLVELDGELTLDGAEGLRLSKSDEQRIRRLCAEKVRLDATLLEREGHHRESQRQAAQRKRELERHREARDTRPLTLALERAGAQLDLEERLEGERRRAAALERSLAERLSSLRHFKAADEVMLTGALPQKATIARFAREREALAKELDELRGRERQLQGDQVDTARELAELEGVGAVPNEADLVRLREARDATLSALAETAANGAAIYTESLERLQEQVIHSDQYVDRLRTEADRVARKANLVATAAAVDQRLQQTRSARNAATLREQTAVEHWTELWSALAMAPGAPEEMDEWLSAVLELRRLNDELESIRVEVRRLEGRLVALEKDLAEAMEGAGETRRTLWESLPQFVQRAQSLLQAMTSEREARRTDEQRMLLAQEEEAENARRFAELREAQRQFRAEWSKALRKLGIDKDGTTDDVTFALDQRAELFRRLREAGDLERRIAGIRRDEKQLEADVLELTQRVAPQLSGLPLEAAAEGLLRGHKKALGDTREKVRLELELERHRADLHHAKARASVAKERIEELLRLGRVESLEELSRLEKRVQQARALDRQRIDLENEILSQGEGEDLEALLRRASEASAEQLREQSSEFETELGILDEKLELLVQRRTKAEAELGELGEGAALAAEELAQRTATLRADVRRYMRLCMASAILAREVERYREEHQGPVLRRAAELFPRLTLGAYRGLETGFDKNDEPVLLCVASDGNEKRVESLSDGTRDQLYLSLRLATLEHFMEKTAPMPLVLDDILIHFDDDRARAALAVLGDVAQKAQVLFFTHHARLVELAREAIAPSRLGVCELSPALPEVRSSLG